MSPDRGAGGIGGAAPRAVSPPRAWTGVSGPSAPRKPDLSAPEEHRFLPTTCRRTGRSVFVAKGPSAGTSGSLHSPIVCRTPPCGALPAASQAEVAMSTSPRSFYVGSSADPPAPTATGWRSRLASRFSSDWCGRFPCTARPKILRDLYTNLPRLEQVSAGPGIRPPYMNSSLARRAPTLPLHKSFPHAPVESPSSP